MPRGIHRTKKDTMMPRTNELRVKAESRNAGSGRSDQLEARAESW